MNSKDKTRQKLVNSMRKTKAGTGKKSAVAETERKPQPQSNTEKPVIKKTSKKAKKVTARPTADPYQSVARIWPD